MLESVVLITVVGFGIGLGLIVAGLFKSEEIAEVVPGVGDVERVATSASKVLIAVATVGLVGVGLTLAIRGRK